MGKPLVLFISILFPCIVLGQALTTSGKFQTTSMELAEKHPSSTKNSNTAWVDTTVMYCLDAWDTTAAIWKDSLRYICTYDASGNELELKDQIWDGATWVNQSRLYYIYDNAGNKLENTEQFWSNGAWEFLYKHYYTYDNQNNRLSRTAQKWVGNAWVNDSAFYFYFDTANIIVDRQDYLWDGSAWDSTGAWDYTYNSNGYLVNRYLWPIRYNYGYDGNGNLTSVFGLYLPTSEYIYGHEYSYDFNGNLIESLSKECLGWSCNDDAKITYTYDLNNNAIGRLREISNGPSSGSWYIHWKDSSSYDINGNLIESTLQRVYLVSGPLVNDYRITSCTFPTSVTEPEQDELLLYPNPMDNHLTVTAKNPTLLRLFNLRGQQVLTTDISSSHTLNTSQLSRGIYFLRATSERGVATYKLVKH